MTKNLLSPRESQVAHALSNKETAVAVDYATKAISRPKLLAPDALCLLRGERELVPLPARGLGPEKMAGKLQRPLNIVRRDGRRLFVSLGARNRPHAMKRACQFEILREEQVVAWLR
ncbi:hypothetical protein [Streptomyces sp. CB02959]|uniref:hypothetical protein n=1 Tax=Streptomyces sp. CB02959 TaxID=2020330 RepID=UPI002152E3F7|nr:hypothetical protein [Streptomyces sp. CB02959]